MKKITIALLFTALILSACASGPKPRTETLAYAKLNNERVFDYPMTTTWKAIQEVFRNYKITSQDASDAHKRKLETDWIYSQSRDRYATIVIDKIPRQQPLQDRVQFKVRAETLFGGTRVTVETSEEIETIHDDGTHAGYDKVSPPDPSRAADILDKTGRAILAAPPTAAPDHLND